MLQEMIKNLNIIVCSAEKGPLIQKNCPSKIDSATIPAMLQNTEVSAVNTEQAVIMTILLKPVIEFKLGEKWGIQSLKTLIQK